jgi:hypothetical protein
MICFIASVDTPAWRKNLSLYQPTRSAGRHGNLRRLKTWTLETFMVNVSSTPASFMMSEAQLKCTVGWTFLTERQQLIIDQVTSRIADGHEYLAQFEIGHPPQTGKPCAKKLRVSK